MSDERKILEAGISFGYQLDKILNEVANDGMVREGTDGTIIKVEVTIYAVPPTMRAAHPEMAFYARSNKNMRDGRWIGAGGRSGEEEAALDLIREALKLHITNPCDIVSVHDCRPDFPP